MQIRLMAHASVLIEGDDFALLTDPWFTGTSFNESWGLIKEPDPDEVQAALHGVTHLFISHEHPDHFHVPTLRALPADLKNECVVIVQELHDGRMIDALRAFGFKHIIPIRHRQTFDLGRATAYLYQVAPVDSAMAVIEPSGTVLNLNDTDLSKSDIRRIHGDIGSPQVLLNQFSIATYGGGEIASLDKYADEIISAMIFEHQSFGAEVTIPFASYSYFRTCENYWVNDHRNSVAKAAQRMDAAGCRLVVLAPNESWLMGTAHDNSAALAFWREAEINLPEPAPIRIVSPQSLLDSAQACHSRLVEHFGQISLRLIGPIRFWISDLDSAVTLSAKGASLSSDIREEECHVSASADALCFAFGNSFGMQTLSISGRMKVLHSSRRVMLLRVVCALDNSQFWIRPRAVRSGRLTQFVWNNWRRLTLQAINNVHLARMYRE
jgi:UDP-MurNAc hydroxylase